MSFTPLFTPEACKSRNNFNFLRLLLSIAVIFTHSYVVLFSNFSIREPLNIYSHQQLTLGTLAVNFFFIISGFLITQSWMQSSSVWSYFSKRVLRIYPAFFVLSVICALVVGPIGSDHSYTYIRHLTIGLFFKKFIALDEPVYGATFQHLPCPLAVDGSVWTLKYEFECYILVMMLGLLGALRKKWLPVILFAVCYIIVDLQVYIGFSVFGWANLGVFGEPDLWARFIEYFCAGMTFFIFRDHIPKFRWLFAMSLFFIVASVFTKHALTLTLPIFGSYALLYIASSNTFRMYEFGKKIDLSYGIYIWAWPIQQLLVLRYQHQITFLPLFLSATFLSCLAAAASWLAIEKPALSLKKNKPRTEVRADQPVPELASTS